MRSAGVATRSAACISYLCPATSEVASLIFKDSILAVRVLKTNCLLASISPEQLPNDGLAPKQRRKDSELCANKFDTFHLDKGFQFRQHPTDLFRLVICEHHRP